MSDNRPTWKKVVHGVMISPIVAFCALGIFAIACIVLPCSYFMAFLDAAYHWCANKDNDTFAYCWWHARNRRDLF